MALVCNMQRYTAIVLVDTWAPQWDKKNHLLIFNSEYVHMQDFL